MVKATIRLYLLLALISDMGIAFISATYVMYLISKGMNLFEVNLVNMVFYITLFICEIPTGVFADVFGRKFSFICSCFLFSAGGFIYAFTNSFWGFALAEGIAAVGHTFSSGAFQAWLVDRARHFGYEGSLASVFGKEQQISNFASMFAALLGAYLADKNLALPWICSGTVMFGCGVLALVFMKEEYFVKQKLSFSEGLKSMKEITQVSIQYGIKSKVIRFILLLGTIQFFAVQAPNMQWQPFFAQFLSSKKELGFVWVGMCLAMIIGAAFPSWFLKKIRNEQIALTTTQIWMGIGIILTACFKGFPLAISFFLFHEIARGLFKPVKDVYLNDNIPSKERATLISFESMSHHIGGAIGLVLSGFIAQRFSIPTAWIFCGTVLALSAGILMKNGKKL